MPFDLTLLESMLVCTKCRGRLIRDADVLICVGPECRTQFAIRDEIPNMLLEDAAAAATDAWSAAMQRAGRDPRQ
ncbi:MAG: Trm112 family protein [Planctomycetales bacterium]